MNRLAIESKIVVSTIVWISKPNRSVVKSFMKSKNKIFSLEKKCSKGDKEFHRQKMNVKVAALTQPSVALLQMRFSNLCLQIIQALKMQMASMFKRIRAVDRLFDFLNTRNPFFKSYKNLFFHDHE